jgi:hypothetical protein
MAIGARFTSGQGLTTAAAQTAECMEIPFLLAAENFLATGVLQPAGLLYCPLWTFQLWSLDAPAPTDAFRTIAAELGTYGRE